MQPLPFSVRDPVCGMEISPKNAAATSSYQGQTFYFCRVECQRQFNENPERFSQAANPVGDTR
jgi:Cu+-exporting ATPase